MKITHCNLRTKLQTLVLTAILAISGTALRAQTVTISPKTGNVISAVSYSSESHLEGYGGAWIHNQMPLNLFVSDEATLGENGLMAVHANNIKANDDGTFMMVSGSGDIVNHFSLSLPKGYRFTGYKIVFEYSSGPSCTLSERNATFSTAIKTASTVTRNSKNATLERTSTLANDMGNVLYFYQGHEYQQNASSYIKITSFEISFECDKNFIEAISPSTDIADGVDCAQIPFTTGRVDVGEIEEYTNKGYKSMKYNYEKVQNLPSYILLYDEDAISGGTASPDVKKSGNIKSAGNDLHYALQNDVYYIETPTEAITQNNNSIPVGYRITGVRLHYACSINVDLKLGSSFYITDGKGKYMNTSLKFTSAPVLWQSTTDGKVYNGSTYLMVEESGILIWKTYSLTTTTQKSKASNFKLDGANLYYSADRSNYYVTTDGNVSTSGTKATLTTASQVSQNSSTFTLSLYGTDGNTPVQTTTVNAGNANGVLEADLLNNDAVKFEVANLNGDAAYVYAELTMEALNPYISRMDVVGTVASGEETLSQSFLADDFTVGENGEVSFNIPDNFESETVKISFDNLTSKKADDTYGPLKADGYSRYHFVKSDYYETIAENLQAHRTEAANSDYTKKVKVEVAGSQAFKVNNSDEFKAGTTGGSKTSYQEFRYTHSAYAQQGGSWNEVSLTRNDTEAKDCYLVTCDETRYNIAPTTTPRHAFYAFYNTKVKLAVQDYEPALTYTKVYNSAVLATGLDNNAYYGVKVGAKMKNSTTPVEAGTGYLFAKQILDQINADAGKDGCPKDAKHLLYVDASDLNTVLSSAENVEKYGKMELIQNAIGPNAMIYLPAGVTYTLKNVASKSASGDFKAENDIILVDKQPFFAPYDIRVDANNYTQYTREVTSNYGKSTYLTLVLPFTVDLSEDGTHTNAQGGSSFQFYNMQLSDALSAEKKDNYNYEVKGHFTPVEGSFTESNKPYLVNVLALEENADDNTIFVVRQNGASIVKTPTGSNGLGTPAEGETANGKIGTDNYTFTQYGTFNGEVLDGKTADYFYFAKNRFLASYNLDDPKQVYMMPFRTYYKVSGTNNSNIATLEISFDPNGESTGIEDLNEERADSDFSLSASNGTLTITANKDGLATVRNLNGQCLASLNLSAGQSGQVTVPAGIYLVNGIKVLIK